MRYSEKSRRDKMVIPKQSSANTLFNVTAVAEEAGVTRQTIYSWLGANVIGHSYYVGDAPLFTLADLENVKKVADERRQAFNLVRLK
jgi:hypothetical protein